MLLSYSSVFTNMALSATTTWPPRQSEELLFQEYGKPVYSYSTNPDRRFSSSTSQHFKMSPPFASSEGVSASGDRLQSDGVQDTHLLPHSLSTRIRERMCDFALTHSPFAYIAYFPSYSLLIILSEVL